MDLLPLYTAFTVGWISGVTLFAWGLYKYAKKKGLTTRGFIGFWKHGDKEVDLTRVEA